MAASAYIVFSGVPEGISDEQRDAWHTERVASLLDLPGVVAAQRYRLTPLFENDELPYTYELAAILEVNDNAAAILEIDDADARTDIGSADETSPHRATDVLTALQRTQRADLASWTAIPVGARAVTK